MTKLECLECQVGDTIRFKSTGNTMKIVHKVVNKNKLLALVCSRALLFPERMLGSDVELLKH